MNTIIDLANTIFKPLIDLGAAPLMTIVLTLIALCFGKTHSRIRRWS